MNNNNNSKNINVTSNNQQGGITAGIINIFYKNKVVLSDENKKVLTTLLKSKSEKIFVSLQSGAGSELTKFAEDIKSFLTNEGYNNIQGVNQIFGYIPFNGVKLEKKSEIESVIFIGALMV